MNQEFIATLKRATEKGLKRLTMIEFLCVCAWWEYLKYGGDDPRLLKVEKVTGE